jgi:hypothetical protein
MTQQLVSISMREESFSENDPEQTSSRESKVPTQPLFSLVDTTSRECQIPPPRESQPQKPLKLRQTYINKTVLTSSHQVINSQVKEIH